MKFDDKPYFSDFVDIAEGLIKDLFSMAIDVKNDRIKVANISINDDDVEAVKNIMRTPIYRGYVESKDNLTYLDVYKYGGGVYTESELQELIKEQRTVVAAVTYAKKKDEFLPDYYEYHSRKQTSFIEDDCEPEDEYEFGDEPYELTLSVYDLFFYKNGPCGKEAPYVVAKEKEEEIPLKYVVSSFYNETENWALIKHATKEDLERDGENWCGRNDAYRVNCYDTLKEAIEKAGFWPPKITFEDEFSDEEKEEIVDTINTLTKDADFCTKFGKVPVIESYTIDDIFPDEREVEV